MEVVMTRITRLSVTLHTCFWIGFWALPLVSVIYWAGDGLLFLQPWLNVEFIPSRIPEVGAVAEMSMVTRVLGFALGGVPMALNMMALYWMARLFGLFAKSEFFLKGNVQCIQKAGTYLLANQLIYPFYVGAISMALTIGNAPGHRMLCIEFGTHQIGMVIVSLTILVIAWIMDEARKMHDELKTVV